MIFVDTSAWFARYTPRDSFHQAARDFLKHNRQPLVTSDYVVDETLTLFKIRGNYDRALIVGPRLLTGQLAQLTWVEPIDVQAAWEIYSQYRDKQWSFTDCVSDVLMQRLEIKQAFAFDTHFRQFGIAQVFPG